MPFEVKKMPESEQISERVGFIVPYIQRRDVAGNAITTCSIYTVDSFPALVQANFRICLVGLKPERDYTVKIEIAHNHPKVVQGVNPALFDYAIMSFNTTETNNDELLDGQIGFNFGGLRAPYSGVYEATCFIYYQDSDVCLHKNSSFFQVK